MADREAFRRHSEPLLGVQSATFIFLCVHVCSSQAGSDVLMLVNFLCLLDVGLTHSETSSLTILQDF